MPVWGSVVSMRPCPLFAAGLAGLGKICANVQQVYTVRVTRWVMGELEGVRVTQDRPSADARRGCQATRPEAARRAPPRAAGACASCVT